MDSQLLGRALPLQSQGSELKLSHFSSIMLRAVATYHVERVGQSCWALCIRGTRFLILTTNVRGR